MRSRDRLAEFRQRCGYCEGSGEGGVYQLTTVPRDSPPPPPPPADPALARVLHQVEQVQSWLQQLEQNAGVVAALHAGERLATADGAHEQLEALTAQSSRLGSQVLGALQRLQQERGGGAAARVARLQAAAWRGRARGALRDHERALHAARDLRHKLLTKQILLTNASVTEEECEELLDSGNVAIFVDNVGAQTAAARAGLRAAEERRGQLAHVEAALADVHALFAQLAALVHQQQESIDTIEYLSSTASRHVDGGGRELLQGSVSRRKTRKKKLSVVVCVATGAAVVLAVLLLT